MIKRLLVYIISTIFIVCLIQPSYADTEAEEYSLSCTFSSGGQAVLSTNLTDLDVETRIALQGGASLEVSWAESVKVEKVFYELTTEPTDLQIDFFDRNGAHIGEKTANTAHLSAVISVPEGTGALTLTSSKLYSIATFRAFGSGILPNICHEWEQAPDKQDYLVIAAHPDDVTRCMGGAIAGQLERTGSVLFVSSRNRTDLAEGINAAWNLGLRFHPIVGEFRGRQNTKSENDARGYWDENEVLKLMVYNIRLLKPDVVITHATNGECDGQHMITSRLVRSAVEKAADSEYILISGNELETWSVKKLYLHSDNNDGLTIDTNDQINERIMAANACYISDTDTPKLEGEGNVFAYELVYSTVGNDGDGGMFSNLEPLEVEATPTADTIEDESEQNEYTDDFASPIPVSEPISEIGEDLKSPEPTKDPTVKAEVEESEYDLALQQGKKKSIWLIGVGAVLSFLLFVFTFRWFRYSKNTIVAILICLLPLFFMVAAYLLIVNITL